ncbi:glycosyltransferase family 2 protein [Chitinophaga pollutisoli]|uniref:Glycosyltransferase family 2 protein n=1 Tax=Chitinophaga pollutisoli TaxID=3133966 RepID=A0ABZ2YLY8_9BACT
MMNNTNAQPRVTIVIATFNAEAHLPDCLASIAALELDALEVVVADGGSTDGTMAILRESPYPFLRWTSEPDKGIYDALNKGAKMARGTWVHFLGSDDRLLPGFAELYHQLKDPNTIYYANSEEWYSGEGKPKYHLLGGKFNKYRMAKYTVNHQAIVYPSVVFRDHAYDLKYKILADYALNIQLWGSSRFRKQYLPLYIAKYNMNGFSSDIEDWVFKADKPMLIRRYLGLIVYWRYRLKVMKKKREGHHDF